MSISYIWQKGKGMIRAVLPSIFLSLASFLAGFVLVGGIAIWYLQRFKTPLTIEPAPPGLQLDNLFLKENTEATSSKSTFVSSSIAPQLKLFVASKRGKSYYSYGCKAGESIAEANRIWFSSRKEAEQAGFAPSKSCKDLK